MKKFLAIFLTLTMILTMSAVPAFAVGEGSGSITINGVTSGTTYEIYKILDLDSYYTPTTAGEPGRYSYVLGENSPWEDFFKGEGAAYISFNETGHEGYAVWKGVESADRVIEFSKLALAYAEAKRISPVKSSNNPGDFTISEGEGNEVNGTFSGLDLGYYLVDSDMGALCGLTTTKPTASIEAKNGTPTLTKEVKEDSDGQYGDKNTADIGQTVEYKVEITAQKGAQNYVMHDVMSAGLSFKPNTLLVTLNGTKVNATTETTTDDGQTVVVTNYEVKEEKTEGVCAGCTFHVVFSDAFCKTLDPADTIVVTYNALLDSDAVIHNNSNPNTAWLSYGTGNHTTTPSKVDTYTFAADIIKTDALGNLINGAKFRIYDAATGGNEIKVVAATPAEGSTIPVYRVAADAETGVDIVVTKGQIRVIGLDSDTYYLEEIEQPAGYNKLTERVEFTIGTDNLYATIDGDVYQDDDGGVRVINNTGTVLPETGGFGTTMFILLGGLAVMAAGIFLFINKRMSQIAE